MDKKEFFKRCLLVFMTAAMCVSLSACKKTEKKSALQEASTSDEQAKILEEAKSQANIETEGGESDTPDATQAPDGKAQTNNATNAPVSGTDHPQTSNEDNQENTVYSPGTLTDVKYESAFVGVSFELPDGFIMEYTPEDIKRTNEGLAQSENEGERYMKYEMNAVNQDENLQVIVNVDGNKGDYDDITYLANVAKNYETTAKAQVDRTATYQRIAGHDYAAMKINIATGNILYCVRKSGDNMISIIILVPEGSEDKVTDIMDNFKPYNG